MATPAADAVHTEAASSAGNDAGSLLTLDAVIIKLRQHHKQAKQCVQAWDTLHVNGTNAVERSISAVENFSASKLPALEKLQHELTVLQREFSELADRFAQIAQTASSTVAAFSSQPATTAEAAVDPLYAVSSLCPSSPALCALDWLQLLCSYASLYEDELQVKTVVLCCLQRSMQTALISCSAASDCQAAGHRESALTWRSRPGLHSERLQQMAEMLREDSRMRKEQRDTAEANEKTEDVTGSIQTGKEVAGGSLQSSAGRRKSGKRR